MAADKNGVNANSVIQKEIKGPSCQHSSSLIWEDNRGWKENSVAQDNQSEPSHPSFWLFFLPWYFLFHSLCGAFIWKTISYLVRLTRNGFERALGWKTNTTFLGWEKMKLTSDVISFLLELSRRSYQGVWSHLWSKRQNVASHIWQRSSDLF